MLGADDDPSGFVPVHEPIATAWRRHANWRLGATGIVMESLVPAIIEQKVTGQEAFGGFRALVHRFGERAPGPPSERNRRCGCGCSRPPTDLRAIPSWEWLRLPVDGARSRPIQHAARVATGAGASGRRAAGGLRPAAAHAAGHRGVDQRRGAFRALGDADAVSFGDYHVAAERRLRADR